MDATGVLIIVGVLNAVLVAWLAWKIGKIETETIGMSKVITQAVAEVGFNAGMAAASGDPDRADAAALEARNRAADQ